MPSKLGIRLTATSRLVVGSGIANLWARPGLSTSTGASTLAEAYPGPLVLGIGVGFARQAESVDKSVCPESSVPARPRPHSNPRKPAHPGDGVAGSLGVAAVAVMASFEHAYGLVRAHGETGWTARVVPLTVDGLIYASSMVMLDSARRRTPVPPLARWLLGLGMAATLSANVAHGPGHGLAGAAVAAWPAALDGTV